MLTSVMMIPICPKVCTLTYDIHLADTHSTLRVRVHTHMLTLTLMHIHPHAHTLTHTRVCTHRHTHAVLTHSLDLTDFNLPNEILHERRHLRKEKEKLRKKALSVQTKTSTHKVAPKVTPPTKASTKKTSMIRAKALAKVVSPLHRKSYATKSRRMLFSPNKRTTYQQFQAIRTSAVASASK